MYLLRLTGTSLAYRLYEYRGPTSLAINGYYTNHEAEHLLGYVLPLDSASKRGLLRNRSSTRTSVRLLFGWYSVLVHFRLLAL